MSARKKTKPPARKAGCRKPCPPGPEPDLKHESDLALVAERLAAMWREVRMLNEMTRHAAEGPDTPASRALAGVTAMLLYQIAGELASLSASAARAAGATPPEANP